MWPRIGARICNLLLGKNGAQLGYPPKPDARFSSMPVLVPGTQRFALISAGGSHVCGVDTSAAAFCWGAGAQGQLGTGSQGRVGEIDDYSSTTPLPVAQEGGSTIPFYSVSAGGRHTCGVSTRAAVALSPLPSPSPAAGSGSSSTQPPPSASSSSFPVGAVVGAVVGAAVVAVLAFFALRPRKGWLRKRGLHPRKGWLPKRGLPAHGGDAENGSGRTDSSLVLSLKDKGAVTATPDGTAASQQATSTAVALTGGSQQEAPDSLEDGPDPLLHYISTWLASHPSLRSAHRATHTSSAWGSGSSSAGGSGSDGLGGSSADHSLPPEAHMWQLEWEELEIERSIGRGSYGAVYRARWHETTVAVKVLLESGAASRRRGLQLSDETMRELEAEAAVMIRMRHPNVVQFMGPCQLPPALVTEYCARGSLYDCLQDASASLEAAAELTWARRLGMAIDAGTGLLYLHSRNIVHRDVKSPNYLVSDHWAVKASDFNLSRRMAETGPSLLSAGVTNLVWLAPELMRNGHATTASDVFSFGVVLWELLTWRLPWASSGLSPFQIGAKVVAGERLELLSRESLPGPDTATFAGLDVYCALIQECWAAQPEQRPGMAQVVRRLRGLLEQYVNGSLAGVQPGESAAAGSEMV